MLQLQVLCDWMEDHKKCDDVDWIELVVFTLNDTVLVSVT
jgi:hypothetical protein